MKNTWKQINKADYTTFDVEVYQSERALIEDKIDFAILFNSYDSRALEYQKLFEKKQIKKALLVNFKSDKLIKTTNWKKNKEYLERITEDDIIEIRDLDIFNYHENITKILRSIPSEFIFYGAKWFIDITGEPSIYSVALLKAIKHLFPSPELFMLNVSGNYKSDQNAVHTYFSEGIKEDIRIPFYEGTPDYSKPWKYIFLLGFEGERSLSILKRNEPASSEVVIARPGYKKEYVEMSKKLNKSFLQELNFDGDDIIYKDIGDVVGLLKKFEEIYFGIKDKMNLCLVPLGPKPHALAAGIFALLHKEVSILYQVPNRYKLNEVERGKYMWLYKIK